MVHQLSPSLNHSLTYKSNFKDLDLWSIKGLNVPPVRFLWSTTEDEYFEHWLIRRLWFVFAWFAAHPNPYWMCVCFIRKIQWICYWKCWFPSSKKILFQLQTNFRFHVTLRSTDRNDGRSTMKVGTFPIGKGWFPASHVSLQEGKPLGSFVVCTLWICSALSRWLDVVEDADKCTATCFQQFRSVVEGLFRGQKYPWHVKRCFLLVFQIPPEKAF